MGHIATLYNLALRPIRGSSHQCRLESFYGVQAESYDEVRTRLLPGRCALVAECASMLGAGTTWIDVGCGTASNLDCVPEFTRSCERIVLLDLCAPLLNKAKERVRHLALHTAEVTLADATTVELPPADLITFSYSLTMIPQWFAAVDAAVRALRPGGLLAVVDFYISRKYPDPGRTRHSGLTRSVWPFWFGLDNVALSPDHLPYLGARLEEVSLIEDRAKLPYIPLFRVPYYRFVGRRPSTTAS
jgi:S-adenosylmethionine-diacylgycerolhomoserine-N-methlytransferase